MQYRIILGLFIVNNKNRKMDLLGGSSMKRTYQPKKANRKKRHGFLVRMGTTGGKRVLRARRNKGRKQIAA